MGIAKLGLRLVKQEALKLAGKVHSESVLSKSAGKKIQKLLPDYKDIQELSQGERKVLERAGTLLPFKRKTGLSKKTSTMSVSEDLDKTQCIMFKEKKTGNPEEQPFLMYLSDKSNKELPEQIITESSIPGQYEIFDVMPNGKGFKSGLAEIGKNGENHVERHLVSTDGKTTDMVYRDDSKGNTFLYSVIKDKDGKVLSETRRKFKKISDNHFTSSYNGQSYDMEWSADKVVVTKLDNAGKKTKETVEYVIKDIDKTKSIDEKIAEAMQEIPVPEDPSETAMKAWSNTLFEKMGFAPQMIEKDLVNMMKNIPGDEWFAMKKSDIDKVYIDNFSTGGNNAGFIGNTIMLSDFFKSADIFSHELGHAKHAALNLNNDNNLIEIYNKERKNFQDKFPDNMKNLIDYFLSDSEDIYGNLSGLNETAAETNLLTNTIQSSEAIQSRTLILEKYFPETLAYIKNKFAAM